MSREMTVHDSVVVAADAQELWRQVADPTQMGRWSPENTGANTGTSTGASTGADGSGAGPLTVGASFVGTNRRGRARWSTRCRVTASDPGRRFAFDVVAIGPRRPLLRAPIAGWAYDFEPLEGGGTRVTETWTDHRGWPDALAAVFDRAVTGGRLFADHQRRNIARTLARLKADLEG